VWLRCGDDWGGQDWRGAKSLELEVYSEEIISFEIGFNDANQNAYTVVASPASSTTGRGWQILTIPFNSFQLNPYYQPPGGKKGAPQDLSRIETFNLAPKTSGNHSFKIREVTIRK